MERRNHGPVSPRLEPDSFKGYYKGFMSVLEGFRV